MHIRQIFIKVEPPKEEIERITRTLDSIRTNCSSEKEFAAAVKKFSQDPVSKKNNGHLKWTSLLELPPEIKAAIDSLPVGAISTPVQNDKTIAIYRIEKRVSERALTIDDDYLILEKKASDIFSQKKMIALVSKWRKDIFIDKRL